MRKKFGSLIGNAVTPNITSAKGVWDLRDQSEYNRNGIWPSSLRAMTIKLWGASGGSTNYQSCGNTTNGGAGGYVKVTTLSNTTFTPGNMFYIYVGQGGISNGGSNPSSGGFGGGGASYAGGCDGGGASYIFYNGPQGSGTLLLVAGGGAGGQQGGAGGGSTGANGSTGAPYGYGGTQSGGGSGGSDGFGGGGSSAGNGDYLQGGVGMSCKGSGGGGGYYGGGGGPGDCGACAVNGGGGGGSSYINGSYFNTVYNDQGQSNNTVSTNASSDTDWNGSAGNGSGVVTGTNGYIVIYLNNTKYTFSYTGAVQTLSF